MSRHWKPDDKVIDGPWGTPEAYLPRRRARTWLKPAMAGLLLLGAAGLGFGYGYYEGPAPSPPADNASVIQWNEVQPVPTRTPDAADVAWEKRAQGDDSPSTGSGRRDDAELPTVFRGQGEAAAPVLPRGSAARDDGRTISGKNIYVIDGDTFSLGGQRIRVAGIDAPETHPARCAQEAQLGAAATQKLAELLRGGTLWISGEKTDRYGRSVRTVRVNGVDVADAMIGSGLARNYDGKQRQSWC